MSIDSHDFNNFTTTDWHDLLSNTIDYRDFITLVRIRNMKNRIDELENENKNLQEHIIEVYKLIFKDQT